MNLSLMLRAPNLLTVANATCGLIAILLLIGLAMPTVAASLIFLAFLFDTLDGVLARRAGISGPFGAILDSLADMVSFGIAPSLMIAMIGIHVASTNALKAIVFLIAVLFALATMFRLARYTYNAVASITPLSSSPRVFTGLPAPAAAMMIAAAVITGSGPSGLLSFDAALFGPWLLLLFGLITPILMVGTVRFPDLPKFYLKGHLPFWHLIGAAIFAVLAGFGPALSIVAILYLMLGPTIAKGTQV